jgi:tRNA(fMet)-specific endonuclease VapC
LILADTDVLIDYLNDISPMSDLVRKQIASDNLQTTAISCFELLSGAGMGRRGSAARALVESLTSLSLNREAASRAADLSVELASRGITVPMADSLIAGIALSNDLPLLTRNQKHFGLVEGLRLVRLR